MSNCKVSNFGCEGCEGCENPLPPFAKPWNCCNMLSQSWQLPHFPMLVDVHTHLIWLVAPFCSHRFDLPQFPRLRPRFHPSFFWGWRLIVYAWFCWEITLDTGNLWKSIGNPTPTPYHQSATKHFGTSMKLKCRHAAAYSAALDQLFTSASVEEGSTIATFLVCPKEIWSDFKNLTQITWVLEWSLTYSSDFLRKWIKHHFLNGLPKISRKHPFLSKFSRQLRVNPAGQRISGAQDLRKAYMSKMRKLELLWIYLSILFIYQYVLIL